MSTDIMLAGVGYMLLPGSYRADAVTVATVEENVIPGEPGSPAVPARLTPTERRGRDIANTLATAGAVLGGLGGLLPHVGPSWRLPFPVAGVGVAAPPLATARSGSIASTTARVGHGSRLNGYLTSGNTLYFWTSASANVNSLQNLGAVAVDMAERGDRDLFFAYGSSQDVSRYQHATTTHTTSALGSGEQAILIGMLDDRPLTVRPDAPDTVRVWDPGLGASNAHPTNGRVLAMVPSADGVLVATSQSWYVMEIPPDGGPAGMRAVPRPVQNCSTASLIVHRGRVLASVNGDLWRQNTFAGSWEPIASPGRVDHMAPFGPWVLARVNNEFGASGIWAWNGDAWFLVNTTFDQVLPGPNNRAGVVVNNNTTLSILDDSDPDNASLYAAAWQAATALQGRGLERNKSWLRVGAEFHRPDNEQVGSWSAQLQYSTNAGRTWVSAGGSQAVTGEHLRITATLTSVTARVLMVRVNLTQTSGLSPVLAALWADWEVTEADGGGDGSPAVPAVPDKVERERVESLRRRWRFTVLAQDGLVRRDGALLGLAASEIRSTLWARLNQTSDFTDVDGSEHSVTLTNIEEEWPSPADQPLHVSTRMKLTLVEGDQTV